MGCNLSYNVTLSTSCPADRPVLKVPQNVASTVAVQLVDQAGNPASISGHETMPYATANIWLKQLATDQQTVRVTGTYNGAGSFTFNVSQDNAQWPGVFLGTILLLSSGGEPVFAKDIYFEVEYNTTSSTSRGRPISVAELRLAVRDSCADVNYLLDDVEFKDNEIAYCIQKPVDQWNEALPPVAEFTYSNFPFRSNWMDAAIGHLLIMVGAYYRRNHLKYSAGGVEIDDHANFNDYIQDGKQRLADYKDWVKNKKLSINASGGFRSVRGRHTL